MHENANIIREWQIDCNIMNMGLVPMLSNF